MIHRVDPYLLEESVACNHLHEGPEHDNRGVSHAQVASPRLDVELLLEHQCRTDEADGCNGVGHGVMVAEEYGVVAEHEQHVESPHHDVPLHEHHYTRMIRHRSQLHLFVYSAMPLYPADEQTAGAGAEGVHHYEHHPHAERGGHDEILRSRAAYRLKFGTREIFERRSVYSERMVYADTVDIFGHGLHNAVAYKIAMYTEALRKVSEKKLHPTCPKEQGSGESEAGLACVALHEHTGYGDYESYKAHQERRIVKRCRLKEVLHQNHKCVP